MVHRSTLIKWVLCTPVLRGLLIGNLYSPLLNPDCTLTCGLISSAKKPALRVEYIHMGLLLGYVVDIVIAAVIAHPDLDNETKSAVLRALNKVIWIQNDCRFPFPAFNGIAVNGVAVFARHYVVDLDTPNSVVVPKKGLLEGWIGQIVTGVAVAVGVLGVQTILGRG